jgi:hypothetical protein
MYGKCTLGSAAHVKPEHATGAARPWPSVDTATQWPAVTHGDTRRGREETARIAENPQLAGRFRRWWQVLQVLGSNQRRLSRQFYSPSLLPKSPGTDQHIRRSRRVRGHRRPLCVRGRRVPGPCGPRTGTDQPTDGRGKGHGRDRRERLRRPSTRLSGSDLAFQDSGRICMTRVPTGRTGTRGGLLR